MLIFSFELTNRLESSPGTPKGAVPLKTSRGRPFFILKEMPFISRKAVFKSLMM